ncbi:MAG: hypothetical protein M3033_13340 [Acidobacteriota bacterium]|nr:hypothetical protein [Acidobacteriota bacterium]
MNRNSYQDVLSDWERKRETTQKECDDIRKVYENKLDRLNKIESAISLIIEELDFENFFDEVKDTKNSNESQKIKPTLTLFPKSYLTFDQFANQYSKENQSKISLCSGSEKVLEQAGKPLHLTEIIKELEKLGRFTDRRILNGTIRKDTKKRFVNLGQNVWDLSSRHPKPNQE